IRSRYTVHNITEIGNGESSAGESGGAGATDGSAKIGATPRDSAPELRSPAAQLPTKSRLRTLSSQNFRANVLQHIGGAFDANLPSEDGVFVFDGQNSIVIDVHIRLDD